MKRFALILVSLLTVFGMYSQIVSSRSEAFIVKKEKKPVKVEFYAKAGLNIMSTEWLDRSYGFNPSDYTTNKALVGFDISLGLMSHFRPSNPSKFYWGGELSLSQVGGGFDEFNGYMNEYNKYLYPSQNLNSLTVCLTPVIGWYKSLTQNVSLDLHFNPGCSFLFKEQTVNYIWSNDEDDSLKRDFSVAQRLYPLFKIGAGIWVKKFNIDFSYKYQTQFVTYNNSYNNFILSLGYKF